MEAVPIGAGSAADIGAGDGQVALGLVRRGVRVIATELRPASFARLPVSLERRLGDGLSVLRPGEVEGVIVAGLGGRTIAGMLDGGREVARSFRWLVLQPQQHLSHLEAWLVRSGYRSLAVRDVDEGRRSYRVLLVEPDRGVAVPPDPPPTRDGE
jgi:tRNA (adenine22-N1)-methyltransferase